MTNTTSYVRNHAFLFLLVRKFVAREVGQRRSTKPRFHHLRVSHSRKGQGGALPANSSEASDEGYTSRSGDCTRAVERQAEVSALPLRCAGSRSKNGPGASTSSSRALQVDASRLLDGGTESDLISDLVYRDGKSRPVQAFRKRVERWITRGVSRLFERQRRRRRMLIASSGSGTSRGERSRYRRRWIPCFQEHTSEKLADDVQEKEASAGIEHLER